LKGGGKSISKYLRYFQKNANLKLSKT